MVSAFVSAIFADSRGPFAGCFQLAEPAILAECEGLSGRAWLSMAANSRQEAVRRQASAAFRALYDERRDPRAGRGEEKGGGGGGGEEEGGNRQDDSIDEQRRSGEEDGLLQDEGEGREQPRQGADRRREALESTAQRAAGDELRRPRSAVPEPDDQRAVCGLHRWRVVFPNHRRVDFPCSTALFDLLAQSTGEAEVHNKLLPLSRNRQRRTNVG